MPRTSDVPYPTEKVSPVQKEQEFPPINVRSSVPKLPPIEVRSSIPKTAPIEVRSSGTKVHAIKSASPEPF